jgi:membrane protein YfhO
VIRENEVSSWIAALQDPRRVAVFDPRAAGWVGAAGEVIERSGSPGRMLLDVPGEGDRLLATSLPQPEGWRAAAGGRPLDTVTVDGAFLGVHIPAGVSRVELRFRPPGFMAGLGIGLLALAATIGLFAAAAR